MSTRDSFWFLAGALVAVAIMVTVRAWLRERPAQAVRSAIPPFAVPIAAALALIGVALGIYFLLGSPDSIASAHATASERGSVTQMAGASTSQQQSGQANAGSLDDVTQKLAARLAAKGGSDNEWKLLAESYDYMGLTAEAKAARAHVASAAPSDANSSVTDEPAVSSEQMAAVADALDSRPAAARNSTSTSIAEISGTVEVVSKLAPRAAAGATLFIYAKQPNAPGPPLAVLRMQAEHWPVAFTLNDANAMVPGRNLSNAQNVQIEARISKSGDALPQSGDLVGSVTSVNPRSGHAVKISIDREIS
jgi:cytochrome c-type biogenesis protein CcmH